jgi:hypothetical protein
MNIRKISSHGLDRRGFVKGVVLALAVVPLISFLQACKGESDAPPVGMTAVDPEKDPTAKALGYHADATKVDPATWPKRGPEGQDQFCNNCSFYTAQDAKWGKCTLIPSGAVKGEGWCNSWTPKA